jgi:hypothetical protein
VSLCRQLPLFPRLLNNSRIGLLVEGEMGLEITENGTKARTIVKFRPREGFVSKLIQRFAVNANVNISPKDFIPPQ